MTYTVRIVRSKKWFIRSGSLRTLFVVTMSMFLVRLSLMPETNAYFADRADAGSHTLSLGVWTPRLDTTVSDESSNPDKAFTKAPCVTFTYSGLTSGSATIWYEFSDDGDPKAGGTRFDGTCVPIPAGNPTRLQAVAINDANGTWRSAVVKKSFTVIAAAKFGDVVINEVMWSGSANDTADGWIELRNMTDHAVDLSDWRIGIGERERIDLPHGYSVRPKGYFLILAKKQGDTAVNLPDDFGKDTGIDGVSDLKMKRDGERLTLLDADRNRIDATPGGKDAWPAGAYDSGKFVKSMERDNAPKDGKDAESWHTCTDARCNDAKYWRDGGGDGMNFGTPGRKNLLSGDTDVSDPDAMTTEPVVIDLAATATGTAVTTTCADASASCVETPSTSATAVSATVSETKTSVEPVTDTAAAGRTDADKSLTVVGVPKEADTTIKQEDPSADKQSDIKTKGDTDNPAGADTKSGTASDTDNPTK